MSGVLITGGAGFIGQHIVSLLLDLNICPHIVDLKSPSDPFNSIANILARVRYTSGDAGEITREFLREHDIDTVIHLAAENFIPASIEDPSFYYEQNVVKTKNLLDAAVGSDVRNFIFASSSSVCQTETVNEAVDVTDIDLSKLLSPYSRTKMMCEVMLDDYRFQYPKMKSVTLRPFNVIGAGYSRSKPVHFLPLLLSRIKNNALTVDLHLSSEQEKTRTCIRTYTDVRDVANAFVRAYLCMEDEGLRDSLLPVYNVCAHENTMSSEDLVRDVEEYFSVVFKRNYITNRKGNAAIAKGTAWQTISDLNWYPKYDLRDTLEDISNKNFTQKG